MFYNITDEDKVLTKGLASFEKVSAHQRKQSTK
jgi:hypothetical protein